jgi:hypothetical protein
MRSCRATVLWHIILGMDDDENVSKRLRREAEELRKAANELMEHAARLIAKSAELDRQIVMKGKVTPSPDEMRSLCNVRYRT